MKKIYYILIVFCLFLISCKNEQVTEIKNEVLENIFSVAEDKYLVLFKTKDSEQSDDAYKLVESYSNDKSYDKIKYNVYVVEMDSNSEIVSSYQGDGQGAKKDFYVDGVKEYSDLKLASLPALILIEKNSSGQKKAKFCADSSNMSKYLISINHPYYEEIEDVNIFRQKEERYLVYFMKDGCNYCDHIKNEVYYYTYRRMREKTDSILKLYAVNLNTGGKKSTLLNSEDNIDGVTRFDNLQISATPTLIEIYIKDGIATSKYLATGKTDVVRTLDKYISKDDNKINDRTLYRIEFDLDYEEKELEDLTFYAGEDVVLPSPMRDDYAFIGWEYNNELLDTIENKNYKLKAKWGNYDFIKDEDVFNQSESNYLVYFVKDDCSYCDKIKNDVMEYYYDANHNNKMIDLYVVNLKKNGIKSEILTPKGDGSNVIDGIMKWDELYIDGTPLLIEVDNNRAMFVAEGATKVKNALADYREYTVDTIASSKYEIEFDNGNVESIYYYKNNTVDKFPVIEKEGYIFLGWYDENDEIVTSINGRNISLYSKWIDKSIYQEIKDEDIFNQTPDRYLIYFMKDDCSYCEKIKNDIITYLYNTTLDKYSSSLKLYIVNLKKDGVRSKILNAKGNGAERVVDNVEKWDDLYVSATPTLIEIKNKKANYIASGATAIIKALDRFLLEEGEVFDDSKFFINFEGEKTISYYKWQIYYDLPKVEKEGYIFLGWYEDGDDSKTVISSVSGKDVSLKPLYLDSDYYKEIIDEEIFKQKEEKYLVYFMKDGCSYCEKIKDKIYDYFSKASQNDIIPLYLVNLYKGSKRSTILNSKGHSDDYIDGVTNWDELYVSATPTLVEISITDGVLSSKYIATGATNVANSLKSYLEKK